MSEHGVVDRSADNPECGGTFYCTRILIAGQKDDLQSLTNASEEKDSLVCADAMPARHPSKGGKDLYKTVSRTAARVRLETGQQMQTGLVMDVVAVERRDQD